MEGQTQTQTQTEGQTEGKIISISYDSNEEIEPTLGNESNEDEINEDEINEDEQNEDEQNEEEINEDEINEETNEKELDNEIQKRYQNINEFLYVCLLGSCFCFGTFLFIYYLPINFDEQANVWRNFSNNCCSKIQNETRCSMSNSCEYILNCWIKLQNSSRNFLSECCYWFSTYKTKNLLLHCNPNCLK